MPSCSPPCLLYPEAQLEFTAPGPDRQYGLFLGPFERLLKSLLAKDCIALDCAFTCRLPSRPAAMTIKQDDTLALHGVPGEETVYCRGKGPRPDRGADENTS